MPQGELARKTFRSLLLRSVFLPLLLMGLLALLLIWQIGRLVASARWVEQTDHLISQLYMLEKLHVDLETGLRGFVLTGSDEFLQPYRNATDAMPRAIAELSNQLAEYPAEQKRLKEIVDRGVEWQQYATQQIERRRANDRRWEEALRAGEGKIIMDGIRRDFSAMIRHAIDLRTERNLDTNRTALGTMIGAGVAAVVIGVLMSLLSRGQLKWLSNTYLAALSQAKDLNTQLESRVDERTRELSASNGRLNEANKELEAFAYSISHDLRAPMRHITGFANLLQHSVGPTLSADDRENLDTIYKTAVLAGRMVDDLLAFSRVGRTQLRDAVIDMNAVVAEAASSLQPETDSRQVTWQIADLLPTRGDPTLVKMVVQNLLSNAVKYTSSREHARIEVGSRAERDGVTYWVRDNGVGFDMAYVHKLFGVFQRLHRAEEFEGTGIGLANVRRIILRHGGQVWAEGLPNTGAAFYFHLPERMPAEKSAGDTI